MLSFKSMRKTKLSLAMSALLVGGIFSSSAHAVQLAGDDKLGDAGIFQYFSAKGNWQTFFRIINTSDQSVLIKVRLREAANSRELRDFVVALSPHDVWSAWTGATASPTGTPGLRTNDTSCIFDLTNTGSTTFQWVDQPNNLQAISFASDAYTGLYADGSAASAADRMSEGYMEVIGIASYDPVNSAVGRNVVHNQSNGKPENCAAALNAFRAEAPGSTTPVPFPGQDVGNVLGFNAQLINTNNGEGAGFDPVVLANFKTPRAAQTGSLAQEALFRIAPTGVGHGTWPSLDSADPHSLMLTSNGNTIASVWDTNAGAAGDGFSAFGGTDVAAQQLLANGTLAVQVRNAVDLNNDGDTLDSVTVQDSNGNSLGLISEINVPASVFATGKLRFVTVGATPGVPGAASVVRIVASTATVNVSTPPIPAFANQVFPVSAVQLTSPATPADPARLTNIAHDNGAAATLPFAVRGGIDAVSALLARTNVANEWAASPTPTAQNVKDYFTQWVVTFPTKHYYVDLQDDPVATDLFAPTLQDPRGDTPTDLNDAFAPFSNEFNIAGTSCENYNIQLYDREEAVKGFTSPTTLPQNNLCNEVNVISFTNQYATQGLASAFSTVIAADQLPISGVTGQQAQRGWANINFTGTGTGTGLTAVSAIASGYGIVTGSAAPLAAGISSMISSASTGAGVVLGGSVNLVRYQGLPVVGFMLANYATGSVGANHNAINAHKYQRSIQAVTGATTFTGVNGAHTAGPGL